MNFANLIAILTTLFFGVLLSCATADEHEAGLEYHDAMPIPDPDASLRLKITLQRDTWGTWETVRFDSCLENIGTKSIEIEDSDKGRGFAGKLMYYQDPDGKVRSVGHRWADPVEYPPRFHGRSETVKPKETFMKFERVSPSYGSPLRPGTYAVGMGIPAGRLAVNGKPSPRIVSKPATFKVVALSKELRQAMNATAKDTAGVELRPQDASVKLDPNTRTLTLNLVNNSDVAVRYLGYFNMATVLNGCEKFAGEGHWHKMPMGWCGTGATRKTTSPGETTAVTVFVPSDVGRYVRFTLRVTDEGAGEARVIVSPPLDLIPKEQDTR